MDSSIYKDIAQRTGGDIYIGVVGPVRTGKSTFIRRFMDTAVLPRIEDGYDRQRAEDELPQSAQGRTIMTTEPKFVPGEGVKLNIGENLSCNVRLIDCVGYLVDGAGGHMDGDAPRMVSTPWSDEKLPFEQAAELGTNKVITKHSTVGVVVTTDGSFSDIERQNYIPPEERVVAELKQMKKPFVVVLNSVSPYSEQTKALAAELSEKYDAPVLPMSCLQLKEDDIAKILETLLYEFPMTQLRIKLPRWVENLPVQHWLKDGIVSHIRDVTADMDYLYSVKQDIDSFCDDNIARAYVRELDLGTGVGDIELAPDERLFYRVLSETTDSDITDEAVLISTLKELTEAKRSYDVIKDALEQVNMKGYGVVTPGLDSITAGSPEVVKQGSGYGISIKAQAPVIHMIKTGVETNVSPVVGSESQSRELAEYLAGAEEYMDYKIFGKSVGELIEDDLRMKLTRLPDDAREKLRGTVEKIINEGSGGLICILL
ncbi:MAG: stage IV sporulation protein A [Firmicutes bacterium]|nr:stage IV sporulation protein A [Bacillota bacterium]